MQNLHTHTVFSDGRNSISEMASSAISLGMTSLGISDHAPMTVTGTWGMPIERIQAYLDEIEAVKKNVSGQLEVFSGLELDSATPPLPYKFDYTIGSVHYFFANGRHYAVDHTRDAFLHGLEEGFHGDMNAMLSNYYQRVMEFACRDPYPIQGHLDLPVKWCGKDPVFDTEAPWYRKMALEALYTVAEAGKIIEINTGAMSRGYVDFPYPQTFLLKECLKINVPILLSSDSHQTDTIMFAFDRVRELLLEVGFRSQMILTAHGWEEAAL